MGLIGVVMACDVRFWCWDCAMIVADCVLDSILRATPPQLCLGNPLVICVMIVNLRS